MLAAATIVSTEVAESEAEALQSALNAKQATLISATNIKTINGSTILGSGDLVVGATDATLTTSDITTNNATTAKHGFLQKLPGGTSTFLRADGAFAAPTASVAITQTEIDFGTTPLSEQVFTITDGAASATSKIICSLAYDAPTGKDLDELDMDNIILKAGNAAIGSFSLYVTTADGSYLADKFKINYLTSPNFR